MSEDTSVGQVKLGGAKAWRVWLIAVAFVVYYFSFQTGYSIVNFSVQKDIGLSITQVGLIAAVYTWAFAIFQFLSGPLLDRIGARRVLLPAIVLVTAGILLFASAHSFEMLLLSQVCFALGACTGFVGAGYVGGTWFGWAKFSFMFGLVQFAASLFSAVGQNLLNFALGVLEWRNLFFAVGGFGVLLFFVAFVGLRDPAPIAVGKSSIGNFLGSVAKSLGHVGRVPHVWVSAAFGALCFGAMLALGVVWAPKLLMARGLDPSTANLASSLLWLGLAIGCFIVPWTSDKLRKRKLPILFGIVVQILALAALLYTSPQGAGFDMALCFAFGFGNAAHMLAFSTAADVVEPENIGTSAAIVNGIMFIMGGVLISRPGMRIGLGLDSGVVAGTMDMAQFAARPLLISVCIALVIALVMKETYPSAPPK